MKEEEAKREEKRKVKRECLGNHGPAREMIPSEKPHGVIW